MYRIAVITDIHGNHYALDSVLKAIKHHDVDHIFCLGDMIGIGPFSNQVLAALFELDNISLVTGNHDEAVLALLDGEPYPKSRIKVRQHHMWIGERLEKKYISRLQMLGRTLMPTIYNERLLMTHYPMKPNVRNAHISYDPFDLTGPPSLKNFTCMEDLGNISLVCFGHYHKNYHFSGNSKTFYSPGSLGCYNKPYARYGIIEIDQSGFRIKQKYVPYDMDTFIRRLSELDIPRKEIILGLYK